MAISNNDSTRDQKAYDAIIDSFKNAADFIADTLTDVRIQADTREGRILIVDYGDDPKAGDWQKVIIEKDEYWLSRMYGHDNEGCNYIDYHISKKGSFRDTWDGKQDLSSIMETAREFCEIADRIKKECTKNSSLERLLSVIYGIPSLYVHDKQEEEDAGKNTGIGNMYAYKKDITTDTISENDEERLMEYFKRGHSYDYCLQMVLPKIKSDKNLAVLVKTHEDFYIRSAAVKRMTDKNELLEIALAEKNQVIFDAAVSRIMDRISPEDRTKLITTAKERFPGIHCNIPDDLLYHDLSDDENDLNYLICKRCGEEVRGENYCKVFGHDYKWVMFDSKGRHLDEDECIRCGHIRHDWRW